MRQPDKVKTSVFSEYENNENDSISSRQLEYWLKHTAPTVQPKFAGIEWTLMSTNSIFQQQEHTLQRNETFESLNKENDQIAFNSARPTISNNSSAIMKSKSYLNAMVDLQNRVKNLEQENNSLKKSMSYLKDERNKVMNESAHITQQLKQRLEVLEPKTKKIEQLSRENKILRDSRQENMKKAKMLEKINKENQTKLIEYERIVQKMQDEMISKDQMYQQLQGKVEEVERQSERTKEAMFKLQERNKILEDMKEKSTTSIIEKYNKSVEMVEELTSENMNLKKQLHFYQEKQDQQTKEIEERHNREKNETSVVIEKLKQQNFEKKQVITRLTNQSAYFKQKYERANEQLISSLRNHAQEIRGIKEKHEQQLSKQRERRDKQFAKQQQKHQKELARERERKVKQQEEKRQKEISFPDKSEKEIVFVEKKRDKRQEMRECSRDVDSPQEETEDKQQRGIADESRIQPKQHPKMYIQSQIEFEQLNSPEQEPIEERMIHETRSLEKETNKSNHSALRRKPADVLSQEQPKTNYMVNHKSSAKSKSKHQTSKSRRLSQERVFSNQREKSQSRSKSRQVQRPTINYSNQHSFILKSCEPVTQQHQLQLYSQEPYIYHSANNPSRNNPTYYQPNEVAEFGFSQRGNPSTNSFSLEKAMLVEINKETIRLIEEQERCIGLLNENISPNERAENLGRMKQISEQIKLNNQKMLELKTKIASG